MLQQTSVARVLPKFDAFIAVFPTTRDLAASPLGEALKLWTGLGYPRRCRNLWEAARVIESDFQGIFPNRLDSLLSLPGIGPYTARAVLAFAFDQDVAVVDTNVSRVLSRIHGRSMTAKELQITADELVPKGLGWEWNQVIMDFGARQCTARIPHCAECPLSSLCSWRGNGDDPAPASAGASKPQARFDGSDRQARGRAMRAVGDGLVTPTEVVAAMKLENDVARADALLRALVAEGLLRRTGDRFSLP